MSAAVADLADVRNYTFGQFNSFFPRSIINLITPPNGGTWIIRDRG